MSKQVKVHSAVRIAGGVVFDLNLTALPATGEPGEMQLVNNGLYAYINVGGILTWYPIVKAPDTYQHDQTVAAAEWVVAHNLGAGTVFYQIQDENGQMVLPMDVVTVDNNTVRLLFAEPIVGKALIMTIGGERGAAGERGVDGESAFQIAQRLGYTGTEADWLLSLKGAKGDTGDIGPEGPEGPQGLPGGDSIFLDKGTQSVAGTTVTFDYQEGKHQRLQVGAATTLAFTGWPQNNHTGEMLLEVVNGGSATVTFPTIKWLKSDGTYVTAFSSSDTPLQASGIDFVLLWTRDNGTTIYGKVMR